MKIQESQYMSQNTSMINTRDGEKMKIMLMRIFLKTIGMSSSSRKEGKGRTSLSIWLKNSITSETMNNVEPIMRK